MSEYAWTVVARKRHWCGDSRGAYWTNGPHFIPAGAPYVRCVAFPGSDANSSDHPWTLRICSDCFCQYGAPMPPPRRPRTRKGKTP